MILGFIDNFYSLGSWGDRLLTASWQGGLLLMVAWVVSRYGRQIPAAARCWLWRIAYIKFVVVLLFGSLLHVPILPTATTGEMAQLVSGIDPISKNPESNNLVSRAAPRSDRLVGVSNDGASIPYDSASASLHGSTGRTVLTRSVFGIWVLGLAIGIGLMVQGWIRMKRLVGASQPLRDLHLLRRYHVLCGRFKLSRRPALASTNGICSPVLVGLFRKTILIPVSVIKSSNREELSLILAHELAHCRRSDLVWNWLLVFVRTCFFFHPLVWLTQSRCSLDQEIACDQLALIKANAQVKSYGNMLVKVSAIASYQRVPSLAVLGVASSYTTLKMRILEMYQINQKTAFSMRFVSWVALFAAVPLMLPVGLIAKQDKPQDEKVTQDSSQETLSGRQKTSQQPTRSSSTMLSGSGNSVGSPNDRSDVSVSVSKNGKQEMLKIEWTEDERANVTYTTSTGNAKVVKNYNLKNVAELASKNKQAFEFYKAHVNTSDGGAASQTVGTTSQEKGPRSITSASASPFRFGKTMSGPGKSMIGTGNSAFGPGKSESQQQSDSSSSSAWQTSSMTNNNGVISRSQDSGTTGNGVVGAGSKTQMLDQIRQLMDKTDNPQMKQQLQQMLNQMQQGK